MKHFFSYYLVLVIILSCVGCGSSRKTFIEDSHMEHVTVVDSMAACSMLQSIFTILNETEDLHITIEEYPRPVIRDSVDGTSRRISIDRHTERVSQAQCSSAATDTVHLIKTDTVTNDKHSSKDAATEVNEPLRANVTSNIVCMILAFVAIFSLFCIVRKAE